ELYLSEDFVDFVASAHMSIDAVRLLRVDRLFWVVSHRIGREGISGLDRFLSGDYIKIQQGKDSIALELFMVMDLPTIDP
ncbi:paraquat-inducible protein B, partial [Vibrio cholerae O1]|nr:paraquat-inducible protein B [Vibrio cholerae O1]